MFGCNDVQQQLLALRNWYTDTHTRNTVSIPQLFVSLSVSNAMVTREIKLFQNNFKLCRRPIEIGLFQSVETCLKLFQNYFRSLLQLTNIFQHVYCGW